MFSTDLDLVLVVLDDVLDSVRGHVKVTLLASFTSHHQLINRKVFRKVVKRSERATHGIEFNTGSFIINVNF